MHRWLIRAPGVAPFIVRSTGPESAKFAGWVYTGLDASLMTAERYLSPYELADAGLIDLPPEGNHPATNTGD